MALDKPALARANPGQPITAQGWNGIIDAVDRLYDFAQTIGSTVFEVRVVGDGGPIATATVVAVPASGGAPVAAIPPQIDRTQSYVLGGLSAGEWTAHVTAPGFVARSVPFTAPAADAPATEPLAITLERTRAAMPDVFGMRAFEAIAALKEAGSRADVLIDITGRVLSGSNLPDDYRSTVVLAQQPRAGETLPATGARLVLSASLVEEPVVEMPNLVGLSPNEAKEVLGRLGLVVGEIKTVFGGGS
ncbi:MAG: PASTA domain-containing protein [Acidobacteriota bacterium]